MHRHAVMPQDSGGSFLDGEELDLTEPSDDDRPPLDCYIPIPEHHAGEDFEGDIVLRDLYDEYAFLLARLYSMSEATRLLPGILEIVCGYVSPAPEKKPSIPAVSKIFRSKSEGQERKDAGKYYLAQTGRSIRVSANF